MISRDTARPSPEFIRRNLIPHLVRTLADPSACVRDSAVIALGKVGGASEVKVLNRMLRDPNRSVRSAAVIALGLLQSEAAIAPLCAVVRAGEKGIELRGGRKPETSLRATAAIVLGLQEDHASDEMLETLMQTGMSRSESLEVKVNATIALGLVRCPDAAVDRLARHLKRLAASTWEYTRIRTHAVVALGRLLKGNSVPADAATVKMLSRLLLGDPDNQVRRSAAIALGVVDTDAELAPVVVSRLARHLLSDRDNPVRNFSALSLGRVGGPRAFDTLARCAVRERSQRGTYAALGLGILCKRIASNTDLAARRQQGLKVLRRVFMKARNLSLKAGYAIALGIAGDHDAGPLLLKAMKTVKDPDTRGYLAVAMGMVKFTPAMEYLRDTLRTANNMPALEMQTAVALGLMGNRDVSTFLVESLAKEKSGHVQASLTQALGFIGDRRAITPLVRIMKDGNGSAITRAHACAALGSIGEDSSLPVLSNLFNGHNYLSSTPSLDYLTLIL